MTAIILTQPHALYRFYAADGTLLYVGLTMDPGTRWKTHSKQKPWWLHVHDIRIEHFPDRASVEAAEIAAIQAERPRYNIVHNTGRPVPAAPAWFARVTEDKARRIRERTPPVDPFGEWLLGQIGRCDNISDLALDLDFALAAEPTVEPHHVELLIHDRDLGDAALAALKDACAAYEEAQGEAGVMYEEAAYLLRADRGHPCSRRIRTVVDVAAHVQLDRDNYFGATGQPASEQLLESAETCAKAGLSRIWAGDRWRHRPTVTTWSDYAVDLFVPVDLVDDAASALIAAELDGNLAPMAALTSVLTDGPVR